MGVELVGDLMPVGCGCKTGHVLRNNPGKCVGVDDRNPKLAAGAGSAVALCFSKGALTQAASRTPPQNVWR